MANSLPGQLCSIALLFCALMLGSCADKGNSAQDLIVREITSKSFDDVIFELDFAITERNFRITGRNTIGKGLRDRGYEDFPDVEVIHFCNLEYAHEVLAIDPGYVAQMPCRITIHTTSQGTVINLILLPENHADERVNDFARRMNVILREIIDFVLERETT
jgi:uncharacterized protein (DUF302 family)